MLIYAAMILVILWLLALMGGQTLGWFIHSLVVIAIILVLVSINREVNINERQRRILRTRKLGRTGSEQINL
jgi:hypothetical protein